MTGVDSEVVATGEVAREAVAKEGVEMVAVMVVEATGAAVMAVVEMVGVLAVTKAAGVTGAEVKAGGVQVVGRAAGGLEEGVGEGLREGLREAEAVGAKVVPEVSAGLVGLEQLSAK